jgi:uncharacterized protein with PIN domain
MINLISLVALLIIAGVGFAMVKLLKWAVWHSPTPKKPEGRYDCMDSCNACGCENSVTVVDRIDYRPTETITVCKKCGHKDYWAYGHFESSQYIVSKCRKYG